MDKPQVLQGDNSAALSRREEGDLSLMTILDFVSHKEMQHSFRNDLFDVLSSNESDTNTTNQKGNLNYENLKQSICELDICQNISRGLIKTTPFTLVLRHHSLHS